MSEVVYLDPPSGEGAPAAGCGATPVRLTGSVRKPLRVAVIGEFNSGKTALVNALVGAMVLPASFVTHTAYPTMIGFAARRSLCAETADRRRVRVAWDCLDGSSAHDIHRLHVGMPLDRLRTLRVIDTPGLGLGNQPQEAQALRACRRADRVIWCTPAMQAWKASEQHFWLSLSKAVRQRGSLAVTFMDVLRSESETVQLM